ncbi:hypothetical protein AARAC_006541 [Aspergillus arachidicola]|uniref:Uncharacterized protein n=1 Tax=Aspergillus arachidicola TaxID=656916 RepID=A0A2G7G933_9EURO|nr:hypothetical protein AARAC_006541 [Aspergillus arachidicola]
MAARRLTPSSEHSHSTSSIRKKVCKACDRCRLKKSKQQQLLLVYGLQELYRRNVEGGGWPGEHLKLRYNGHPLTHGLLMRLGGLGGIKDKDFEKIPRSCNKICRVPILACNARNHLILASKALNYYSPTRAFRLMPSPGILCRRHHRPIALRLVHPIKAEPQIPDIPQIEPTMHMQGVVNPLALQYPHKWPSIGFNSLDEEDLMSTAYYYNKSFEG